jgi:hypothetical protein
MRFVRYVLAFLALLTIPVWAQTPTGTISGNVTDSSGAAVAGAAVTVTETGTNATFNATTDASGRYTVPFIQPGNYTVGVIASGFTPAKQTGLTVTTASEVTADFKLTVGKVSDVVVVTADAQRLDTETSNLSSTIGAREILDLPDNGRNPFDFAVLSPGVSTVGGASTPHIGGSRNGNNEQLIDGMTNILPENNVGNNESAYTPIVDSVQEVNVQSSVLEAEYGRFSGGIISLTTKGGTNQFHGSAYEFLENNGLAALPFGSAAGTTSADSHRYQTGGTFSGPLRRDKTFFFVDFEDSRQSSGSNVVFNLPASSWLTGDFTTLADSNGNQIPIYDPLTVQPVVQPDGSTKYLRTQFPGNKIPANRLTSAGSLIAQKVLSYYPTPASATQETTHTTTGNTTNDYDHFDTRVDQQFSTKYHAFLRFSHFNGTNTYVSDFGNVASPGGYNGPTHGNAYSLSFDNTVTFSPTLIGEFRYGFSKSTSDRTAASQGFDPTTLGFPPDVESEALKNVTLFPHFSFSGGYSDIGNLGYVPLQENPLAHDVNGSIAKILGAHTIKVGGEYRYLYLNFYQYTYPAGTFSSDESWTRMNPQDATTGGNSIASFLLGLPSSGDITNDPFTHQSSSYLAFYAQDDWKITRNLTLNYGLRYDVEIPRTERQNQFSVWNPTAASPLGSVTPAAGVSCPACGSLIGAMSVVGPGYKYGRHQVATQKNDFGPRIGFAYSPTQKAVLRGGFGLVFQPSALQAAGTSGSPGIEGFNAQTNFSPSFDNQHSAPVTDLSNPFPSGYQVPQADDPVCRASAACLAGIDLGNGISQSYFDSIRTPYTMQWNLGVQYQLPFKLKAELAYLGNRGVFLINGDPGKPFDQLPTSDLALGNTLLTQVANPFYGIITTPGASLSQPTIQLSQLLRHYPQYNGVSSFRKPDADSIYHAFYFTMNREFSQGLLFTFAFTGGKAIDDSASSVNYLGPASQTYADQYNPRAERSTSAFDVSRLLSSSIVYELPFGHGKMFGNNTPEYLNLILGGWQTNAIITYSAGTPIVLAAVDNGSTAESIFTFAQRPAWTGKSAKLSNPSKAEWFDTTQFSKPAAFTIGNAPRTLRDVRNPHADNLDFSLVKNERWGSNERYNFQFRLEMFNAFNHPLLSAPDTNVNDGTYGQITSYANSARQIQLGFKQYF